MEKKELEDLIVQKLWEISKLYAKESGQEKFQLNIAVYDDEVSCFNDYWEDSQEYPLNITNYKREE